MGSPRRLVVVGLYRSVRKPMYLAVLGSVAGLAWITGSPLLAVYAIFLAFAFHLRVVLYEEPALQHMFGSELADYRSRVRRWLPGRPLRKIPFEARAVTADLTKESE